MSDHRAPRQFKSIAQLHTFLKERDPKPGSSYSLERMQQAAERLRHPEQQYKVVHVGGTSGKGSTCTMIASILEAAGYSVGHYTSPSLVSPLERLVVNQKMATESVALRLVNRLWPQLSDLKLSHFEFFTILALQYFAERRVDYAVIEVGVGGQYDATNIVQPTVAVVTTVGLDHTALLGKTLRSIADHKQAIIKPGSIGLTGSKLIKRGRYIHVDAAKHILPTLTTTTFDYGQMKRIELSTGGRYQVRNAILAIEAARALGIAEPAIRYGLRAAKLVGRFQVLGRRPLIIVDGAHNPQKMAAFVDALTAVVDTKRQRIVCLYAMKSTKDMRKTLLPLARLLDTVVVTTFPRSYSPHTIRRVLRSLNHHVQIKLEPNPKLAYTVWRRSIQPADVGIITGSLYLIGYLRKAKLL